MSLKLSSIVLLAMFLTGHAYAETPSCDALKDTVVTKKGKKVSAASLKVVNAKAKIKGKVIGLCDGGQKKVVHVRKNKSAKVKTTT